VASPKKFLSCNTRWVFNVWNKEPHTSSLPAEIHLFLSCSIHGNLYLPYMIVILPRRAGERQKTKGRERKIWLTYSPDLNAIPHSIRYYCLKRCGAVSGVGNY
jgi:hypothetical protein